MSGQATAYDNSLFWLGGALETTRGTPAAAPSFWIPVILPRIKPDITELWDTDTRGAMAYTWSQTQGPKHTVLQWRFLAELDVLPHVLRSVLGSPDTVTGASAPYTHKQSLGAAQPPSYTWFLWDGIRIRRFAGGQTDTVNLNWKANGTLEVLVRVFTQPPTTVTGITPTISNAPVTTGWDCSMTFNSVAKTNLVRGNWLFNRRVTVIDTLGSQSPYSIFADALDVRGEVEVINQDESEFDTYDSNVVYPLSFLFQNASQTAYSLLLDMATSQTELGEEQQGGEGLITVTLGVLPMPNTTDSIIGGVSPVKATILNSQSAAY